MSIILFYSFLVEYNVSPYIKGRLDNEIMYDVSCIEHYDDNDVYTIEEKYFPVYLNLKKRYKQKS